MWPSHLTNLYEFIICFVRVPINLDLIFILLLEIEIFINCRKMKSLLFLPFFLFLVNTSVMMEYIFLRMVMIV